MKPAPKYQAAMLLHRLGDESVWEHCLFGLLRQHYSDRELSSLREDLISLSTVGWLETVDLREHQGQILRRYRLAPSARRLIEYQLDLDTCLLTDMSGSLSEEAS